MQRWDLLQRRVYHTFYFSCVKGFKVFFATVTEIDPELLFIFTVKMKDSISSCARHAWSVEVLGTFSKHDLLRNGRLLLIPFSGVLTRRILTLTRNGRLLREDVFQSYVQARSRLCRVRRCSAGSGSVFPHEVFISPRGGSGVQPSHRLLRKLGYDFAVEVYSAIEHTIQMTVVQIFHIGRKALNSGVSAYQEPIFVANRRIMLVSGWLIISNLSALTTSSFWVVNAFLKTGKAIRSKRRRINYFMLPIFYFFN